MQLEHTIIWQIQSKPVTHEYSWVSSLLYFAVQ